MKRDNEKVDTFAWTDSEKSYWLVIESDRHCLYCMPSESFCIINKDLDKNKTVLICLIAIFGKTVQLFVYVLSIFYSCTIKTTQD